MLRATLIHAATSNSIRSLKHNTVFAASTTVLLCRRIWNYVWCVTVQDIDRTCDWFRESFSDFVYVVNSLQRATVPQPLHVCMTLCLHCCLWLYVTWLLTVPQPLHVCMTLCFHCRDRIVGNKSYRDIVLRYVEYREVACMELNGGYTAAGSVPSMCCSADV